jgi:hypothetical protein
MGWWSRLMGRSKPATAPPREVPLPILVHSHAKDALPPGPLEDGIVELEQDDVILHALAGIVQPDGTLGELPEDKLEWARRLSYRHLKREGCLADFKIPIIPAYEQEPETNAG